MCLILSRQEVLEIVGALHVFRLSQMSSGLRSRLRDYLKRNIDAEACGGECSGCPMDCDQLKASFSVYLRELQSAVKHLDAQKAVPSAKLQRRCLRCDGAVEGRRIVFCDECGNYLQQKHVLLVQGVQE